MALRYIDSFDHYQTADIERKWTSQFSPGQITISTNGGRCGSQALQMGGGFATLTKGLTTSGATAIFGFALKYEEDALAEDTPLFTFGPGTDTHIEMRRVWEDGSLQFRRTDDGGYTSLGYTPADSIRMGSYYYVEIKVLLHLTAGTLDVQINGSNVLSLSGIRTLGEGTTDPLPATWSYFAFTASNVSLYYIDDVYAADGVSGTVDDFIGDSTVEYLRPVGDGTTTDWDVTGNANRWSAVDDNANPDGDTDYISTATVDEVNLATYEDPTLVTADVYGVQVSLDATKADSGNRTIAAVVRHDGANYVGADHSPSEGNYTYLITPYDVNPGTSAQWTLEDVQDAEFGVKLTT